MTLTEIKEMDKSTKAFINYATENELYPNFSIRKILTGTFIGYSIVKINSFNPFKLLSKTRTFKFESDNNAEQMEKFLTLLRDAYNLNDVEMEVF